jgi:N-terminal acetyltransferase B complex catalytic subunit
MVSIQPWSVNDIWHYSRVNIDAYTETYSIPFYLYYTMQWPQLAWTVRNNSDTIIGYILGSAKTNKPEDARGHVTAVTVCEDYRRLGIATLLMRFLETVCDIFFKAYFVGLCVRPTSAQARALYGKLGYVAYRQIINYYETLNEDGLDMRKSMPRDTDRRFMVPLPAPVTKEEAGID